MADVIVRVTSTDPRSPLARLVTLPLGLDVWELTQDEAVLQADEAQAARLEAMGYDVEQLQTSESYVTDFDTARTAAGYHSAESLEQELRHLADDHPEIAQLQRIGRSIEGRPILALRIGERRRSARRVAFLGCHHAREWISVEVPFLLAKTCSRTRRPLPSGTGCSRARCGWSRWSTRTATSTPAHRGTGCGTRTGAATGTARSAST
jgi:carboxypeptidase T